MATFVEIRNRATGDTVRTVNLSEERALSTKATLERLYPDYEVYIVTDTSEEDGN